MNRIELIPQDLLMAYIRTIQAMEVTRSISMIFYIELDKRRASIHTQILQAVGASRDDKEFSYELAYACERLLAA